MAHAGDTVTLILGGARSGKSRHAQQLAAEFERVLFVATASASDEEMRAKIERHREERPGTWMTVEESLDVAGVIAREGPNYDVIVIDCLTLYAANLLGAGLDTEAEVGRLCTCLAAAVCPVLLVSNEVGSGVVPEYLSGRRYRDLLGEINQRVARVATRVILMVAGLPLTLK